MTKRSRDNLCERTRRNNINNDELNRIVSLVKITILPQYAYLYYADVELLNERMHEKKLR